MDNDQFQEFVASQFAKMFNAVQEVKDSQIRMESRLNTVESGLEDVKQSQERMENDFSRKLDILYFDWRESQKNLTMMLELTSKS